MFNLSRLALTKLVIGALSLSLATDALADEPKFSDEAGKRLTVMNAEGKPVLSYESAHEAGDDGKVTFDTAKVFYQVVGPDGKQTLTKGAGGKLPHHRGIFIGWNRIKHGGKGHDIWHMRNTTQKHISFAKQETTDKGTTIASRIDWIGTHGKTVLEETRSVTVFNDTDGAYAVIDLVSEITAAHGDLELNGDPEHAGIQYRASQKVAQNNSAKYLFPVDNAKQMKYAGLPWAAQTTDIDGQKWTVQQMWHLGNPDGKPRWSAYRDYGRFGVYPSYKLKDGEKLTLRFRFRVTKGEAPSRAALNAAYGAFVDQP